MFNYVYTWIERERGVEIAEGKGRKWMWEEIEEN